MNASICQEYEPKYGGFIPHSEDQNIRKEFHRCARRDTILSRHFVRRMNRRRNDVSYK